MTPIVIRKTILAELAGASPYMLPAEQVLTAVNVRVRPQLSEKELQGHLRWLADNRMVDCESDELDPKSESLRKWFILEAGRAALRR